MIEVPGNRMVGMDIQWKIDCLLQLEDCELNGLWDMLELYRFWNRLDISYLICAPFQTAQPRIVTYNETYQITNIRERVRKTINEN